MSTRQQIEEFADELVDGEWFHKSGRDKIVEAYLQLKAAHLSDDIIKDSLRLAFEAAQEEYGE